jgi:uncharacterized protein YycO
MTNELKALDILLYKGRDFTSWLIEVGTSSMYSHVAVLIDPKINLGIESNTGHQSGVKAFDLRKINIKDVDVYRIKPDLLTKVQKERAISFLVNHLGASYDWWGVVGLGFLKLLSLITFGLTRNLHNVFQKKKDYFCSELCYETFIAGGLDIVPDVPDSDITSPGDIAKSSVIEKISLSVINHII